MAAIMPGMTTLAKSISKTTVSPGDPEKTAIREVVKSAKQRGLDITGPDGLLKLGGVVLVVAEVLGHLFFESRLQHGLRQHVIGVSFQHRMPETANL